MELCELLIVKESFSQVCYCHTISNVAKCVNIRTVQLKSYHQNVPLLHFLEAKSINKIITILGISKGWERVPLGFSHRLRELKDILSDGRSGKFCISNFYVFWTFKSFRKTLKIHWTSKRQCWSSAALQSWFSPGWVFQISYPWMTRQSRHAICSASATGYHGPHNWNTILQVFTRFSFRTASTFLSLPLLLAVLWVSENPHSWCSVREAFAFEIKYAALR